MRMKTALYGRIFFGASAVLFGVIALMWHDTDTWQSLSKFWRLPLGTSIGAFLMLAQIAGGTLLAFSPSARWGSVVLSTVYGLFSLVCVPGIIAAPTSFLAYYSFFEQFAMFCGAIAVYSATGAAAAGSAALGSAARIGLGICAIPFTLGQIIFLRFTASLVPAWIPPGQMFWAILTTVAFALAALAILINVRARLALSLMTLMLGLFGLLVWVPRLIARPGAHGNWSEFAFTCLIAGAAWMVTENTT